VEGLSASPVNGEAHSVLCKSPFSIPFPFYQSPPNSQDLNTIETFASSDSQNYGSHGDWDYGFFKGECPKGDFIIGLSQTPDGRLNHALCSTFAFDPDGYITNNNCSVRALPGDSPSNLPDGDWAYGYYKLA